jgi:adenylosuccinate synthase
MDRRAVVVTGLLFGDEGKGTIVDALVRKMGVTLVCKMNGGAQASHHVVNEDGIEHGFHQWGAGTFAGADTFLSRHFLFNPLLAFHESEELKEKGISDPFSMLFVDEDALVTTPYHMTVNRLQETVRGVRRHGSCGMGIGATVEESLVRGERALRLKHIGQDDFRSRLTGHCLYQDKRIENLVHLIPDWSSDRQLRAELSELDRSIDETAVVMQHVYDRIQVTTPNFLAQVPGPIIFEGAQGVLLDQDLGVQPHTTWSKTTAANALELCQESGLEPKVLGVTRHYMTRHGAGPLKGQDPALAVLYKDARNPQNDWQGKMRYADMDMEMLEKSCKMTGADFLAVTCLDQGVSDVEGHRELREACAEVFSKLVGVPLMVTSWGPKASDKRWVI